MIHADLPAPDRVEPDDGAPPMTPAGLQPRAELQRRRILMLGLNLASYVLVAVPTALVLGSGGWTWVDGGLFACCLVALPWTLLGFWNAVIGFWLLRRGEAGLAAAAPFAGERDDPIRLATAVVMTLRNEDPVRAIARLQAVKASLDATGQGEVFAYHVLSDTDDPAVAAEEERIVAAWRERSAPADRLRIGYRRRADNAGFKAGNLQDFCARSGSAYDLMLPLDADSAMTGPFVQHLVRIMQAHPGIGILQSLVVGSPTDSPFARIFQFGMRQGMRPFTIGSAWWTGDCGPFWGHNALVRIRPFAEHCRLPAPLPPGPFGGPILSHDQIEAVLMRRAGYEVRVLPAEGASFEDNPPTLLDHVAREARWCFGNMQYARLLGLPDLLPVSRFQLVAAMAMFLTAPAVTMALALLPWTVADDGFPTLIAASLYLGWLAASVAPKLAGYLDLLLRPSARRAHGGGFMILAGAATELVFSFLLLAVGTFRLTIFLAARLGRRSIAWGGQHRDARGVGLVEAWAGLWPCGLFGLAVCCTLAWRSPALLLWSLPLTLGYLVAIPFAMATASPRLGRAMVRLGLCATPEEVGPSKT